MSTPARHDPVSLPDLARWSLIVGALGLALGVHDHYGVHKTNIVFKPHNALGVGKARFDSVAVLKDPYDAHSTKRYKMVTFQYNDEDYYAVDNSWQPRS